MGKISVVVNVVEEELGVLPRALESVGDWADETVLIDMTGEGSGLRGVAEKYNAEVFKHMRVSYVEPVRNFSIEKAKGEWVLIMDPDEELSENLKKKLKEIIRKPEGDYFRIPRKNIIFGKWLRHSRWWPDYNIRFFRKGKVEWTEEIHGVPITTGKGVDLEAREENALVHYHYDTLEQYVERMNRYTTQHARNLVEDGYKFDWRDLIGKPVGEFLSRYFAGEGYKDGVHGLALAMLQGASELTLYLKVWQASGFKEREIGVGEVTGEMKKTEREMAYWQADALIKSGRGGILQRVKRKFKLR